MSIGGVHSGYIPIVVIHPYNPARLLKPNRFLNSTFIRKIKK